MDKLEITCPSCEKDNTVNLSTQLKCKHCETFLTNQIYIKKPTWNISTLKSIFLGTVLGAVGIGSIYFLFKTDRYTAREEYAILSDCVKQNQNIFGRSEKNKETICIDAYNQTLEDERELGQKLYAEKSQIFNKIFDQNVEKLSK